MSRILRRPMFRGGRVDSRGTGITTGLDRPGMQGGGMPPATTGRSLLQRATDFFTKPALGPDGQPIPVPRRNFAEDAMFFIGPGKFLKAGGGGLNILRQAGKFANKPDFIGTTSGVSQRTLDKAPFLSNQYLRELVRPYTSGMKETAKEMVKPIKEYSIPFGLGTLGTGYGLSKMYEGFKERQEGTEPPVTEEEQTELSPEQIRIQELENLVKKLTETETKPKETDMEESVEIDKEKFAKLLGRDKARGQDVADMLLSFSSKALAPEADVKSAFAEFAADEVKRPSRTRAIEDNAAALAINKYIKGEISKQEAETLIKRLELQAKFADERAAKTGAEYIQASDATTFAGRVKEGLNSYYSQSGIVPTFEVVESKDMLSESEGGKFKFSAEDIGVIYIETDTKKAYTFNSAGKPVLIYQG
jgi:hypothetical protein